MSTIQEIPLKTITGDDASLTDHAGKVLLLVNVASQCGLTPQYEQLEKIYEERRDKGFEVLGFPANNFGAQEPGTDEEIAEFCRTNYSVKFPMFSKIDVNGDGSHPLYTWLRRETGSKDIGWNFEKFLVARDGTVVRRFAPAMTPDDPVILAAIDEQLAR